VLVDDEQRTARRDNAVATSHTTPMPHPLYREAAVQGFPSPNLLALFRCGRQFDPRAIKAAQLMKGAEARGVKLARSYDISLSASITGIGFSFSSRAI